MTTRMNAPMGLVTYLIAISLIAAGLPDAIHAQDAPKLAVVLSIEKTSFAVNEPVQVLVRISNPGTEPLLIGNDVSLGGGVANLELTLKDAAGRVSPKMHLISGYFASQEKSTVSTTLLGSWMLLLPGSSLTTRIPIDGELFAFVRKPGRYSLSADYYSDGFLYATTYRERGLADDEVASIPFACWHGKIGTNTIRSNVVSGPNRKTIR